MLVTKRIDLELLDAELTAANAPHNGIAMLETLSGIPDERSLLTYDEEGLFEELSDEAIAVVNAHVAPAPLVNFTSVEEIRSHPVRTIGTTPAELYRTALAPLTGYDFSLTLIGVNAVNGAVRKIVASITVKRLNGGPLLVGTLTQLVNHADANTTGWSIVPSFDGNDAVISVAGAAGQTVDWNIRGEVVRFSPGGNV